MPQASQSFFSLLQKNVLDRRSWATRQELRIAIVIWIERTYHRRRQQARLGRLTSIEFEAVMNTPAALAARLETDVPTARTTKPWGTSICHLTEQQTRLCTARYLVRLGLQRTPHSQRPPTLQRLTISQI